MRPLIAALLAWGCASGRDQLGETSPRFRELRPRRIAVAVAGEEPVDAQGGVDRFALRYPDPIRPDTVLPRQSDTARDLSAKLADALVGMLRARGYEATAIDVGGARVGALLRPEEHDAVLVVHYRATTRWPISEYQHTEIRPLGGVTEEIRHFTFVIERGLLLLPTASLLDARTSLRLWSRSNLGLSSDRVGMDSPLRRLGVVAEPDHDPPPLDQLVPRAIQAVVPFYFDSLPAAAGHAVALRPARTAELRDEAAVDRFRETPHLLVDVGGGYARRTLTAGSLGDVELDGDGAFGGYWEVEAGLRVLGRRWLHGGRVAFSRSGADYQRVVLDTSPQTPTFSTVSLRRATALDLAYTLSRAWQPRRSALLAAGLGPAFGFVAIDGEAIDDRSRVQAGVAAEAEALWAGEWLLAGPFARTTWLYDFSDGRMAPTLALGARLAAAF